MRPMMKVTTLRLSTRDNLFEKIKQLDNAVEAVTRAGTGIIQHHPQGVSFPTGSLLLPQTQHKDMVLRLIGGFIG